MIFSSVLTWKKKSDSANQDFSGFAEPEIFLGFDKIRVQNEKPTVKFHIRDIGNNGNVVWQKNKTDNNCKRMYFGQLVV